jgi:hypothetical protein
MATSFGTTTGLFGIAAQQTGFLLDSTSDDYMQDSKTVKNITGDDTGESYYNEKIEGTLDGWIPSTAAFSGTLASAISLATAPADHLIGAVTGGTYIVTGLTRSSSSEDYRRISVKYKYSPTILA